MTLVPDWLLWLLLAGDVCGVGFAVAWDRSRD